MVGAAELVDPVGHRGAAVVAQGERVARKQGVQAGDSCASRVQAGDLQVGTQGANRGDMDFVFRVVDEGAEENAMVAGEVLQQVVGAHLVALVGRIRQSVDEIEDIRHLRLAEIADDMRPQPVGQTDRHAPPCLDEELVLGIVGVVLRDGVVLVEAILVMQRLRFEPPVFLEGE